MIEELDQLEMFSVILRLLTLVSGDLGFRILGFLLCGVASMFLSDAARLGVGDLSESVGQTVRSGCDINGTGRRSVKRLVCVWGL